MISTLFAGARRRPTNSGAGVISCRLNITHYQPDFRNHSHSSPSNRAASSTTDLLPSIRTRQTTISLTKMPPRCVNAPSAAKLFVQLSTGARQSSILEVFLPRQQTRTLRTATAITPRRRNNSVAIQQQAQQHAVRSRHALAAPFSSRRAFSSTTARRRTQAIRNPQVDEEGKEMMLEITPRAAQV